MSHSLLFALSRIVALALAFTSCAATNPTRTVELGAPVTLAPSESVTLSGDEIAVNFVTIVSDSRCPSDATCVWAGRVIARFEIRDRDRVSEQEISSGESVALGSHQLTFVSVEPPRLTQAKIPVDQYRVTIRVD